MLAPSPLQSTRWWSFLGGPMSTALVVLLAFVTGLAGTLRDRPLETHEIYVAQTAREMMASGDFVRPVFNGLPRLNKPPLMYWSVIAAASVLPTADAAPISPALPSTSR